MSIPFDELEKKKLAALFYALGSARGVLGDMLDGDFSREQVQRILDATAMSRIAESIGLSEADFAGLDLIERLTEAEKHKIQGYDLA
jgi:hypothetical protein